MPSKLSKDELKNIIQWDVTNWSKALRYWDENTDIKPGQKVLALGEREGGLSLFFAIKGCKIICSDYNEFPDETKQMHIENNVSDLISYKKIDMKSIELESETMDVVVFKSVVGALGNKKDQIKALNEIYRVLKKDGVFLFAENQEGSKVHQLLRKKFVKWGERWCYVNDSEMKLWTEKFNKYKSKPYGVLALFGRTEGQRKILSAIDNVITPITPKKWRYILFGVAIK